MAGILNTAIGAQTACMSVTQHHRVVRQEVLFDAVFHVLSGIHDDGHIAIHPLIGHRFTQVFHRCLQLGMRATTGIQLLPDGFEGTEQRPAFRIEHDDIHHTAGVQRVGFDIVGRVIRGLVTLAPLRAAGLRDVILLTAAHIKPRQIINYDADIVLIDLHQLNVKTTSDNTNQRH